MTATTTPSELDRTVSEQNQRFTIRIVKDGRRYHANITHGVFNLGEPGSSTYSSRTPERCARRALRTVSRIIANQHLAQANIRIEYDNGDWG